MKKVIDEFNNIHYLDSELGRGGQGVVYRSKDADTVIKFSLHDEKYIKNKREIEKFHNTIKKLIFKPIPNDINIAKPLAVLKDEAGYVMNLLSEMEPYATFLPKELSKEKAKELKIPNFLENVDERSAVYFAHYLQTGGLRRKLYTLSRLAVTLFRLHARGLIYFDISHNNIFVNDEDIPLVYLIDADNVEYESINNNVVFTPGFEVPEIVNGEANTLYSDIYAFGILSFLTLTTTHPFDGSDNTKIDWDSDESEKKEPWELPWIEDSKDSSNNSSAGLRGRLTITEPLNRLFHSLFEEGKVDKYKRPTLSLWIQSFEKAADDTLVCCECQMSYYDSYFDVCPYCDAEKPKRLIAISYLYPNKQKTDERWKYVKEVSSEINTINLPKHLFTSLDVLTIDDTFLEITFSKKTRVQLFFNKNQEEVYFKSDTPIQSNRKKISIQSLEDGLAIHVKSDIELLVELRLEK